MDYFVYINSYGPQIICESDEDFKDYNVDSMDRYSSKKEAFKACKEILDADKIRIEKQLKNIEDSLEYFNQQLNKAA